MPVQLAVLLLWIFIFVLYGIGAILVAKGCSMITFGEDRSTAGGLIIAGTILCIMAYAVIVVFWP